MVALVHSLMRKRTMSSKLGALAGRYILGQLLDKDEMVSTFEGLDSKRNWPVLVKLLPKALTNDPARRQKLERLAERLAALEHPNLQSIIEAGWEEGVPYLIAEGIAATPLAEKMGQDWSVEQVARVVTQIGQALIHAHEQGLIHGRLSPQKVLLAADDSVIISELGLEAGLETPWAQVQEALMPYLAPERIQGWLPDARADVYALGVILYEMITGLQPDDSVEQALSWLREIAPEIAPELEPVLARALDKDPQRRYTTVGEFMADLQPILSRYLEPADSFLPLESELPEVSAPPDAPPPVLITPAMEGIPAIPMPEPPRLPTFDWAVFEQNLPAIPLPEPPPMPTISSEGIEFPTVAPTAFLEKPEEPPAPQKKKELAASPTPSPSSKAASSQGKFSPQLTQPNINTVNVRRGLRIVFIVVAVILLLTFVCCCWLIYASDLNIASTPLSCLLSLI